MIVCVGLLLDLQIYNRYWVNLDRFKATAENLIVGIEVTNNVRKIKIV